MKKLGVEKEHVDYDTGLGDMPEIVFVRSVNGTTSTTAPPAQKGSQ